MPAPVQVMPLRRRRLRVKPVEQESFDIQELGSEAANALEAYRRAPWRKLSEQARMAKLRRAMKLLKRIEDLETGEIPMRV